MSINKGYWNIATPIHFWLFSHVIATKYRACKTENIYYLSLYREKCGDSSDIKGPSPFQKLIVLPLPLLFPGYWDTHFLSLPGWHREFYKSLQTPVVLRPPGHSEHRNPDCMSEPERNYLPSGKYIYSLLHSEFQYSCLKSLIYILLPQFF